MENKKDIGSTIKEKLKDLDQEPNESLWLTIDKELTNRRKGKNKVLYFALSSILAVIITTIYLNKEKFLDVNQKQSQSNTIINTQQKNTNADKLSKQKKIVRKNKSQIGIPEKSNPTNKNLTHKSVRLVYSNNDYDEYEIVEKYRFMIKKKKKLRKETTVVVSHSKSKPIPKHSTKRKNNESKKNPIVLQPHIKSKDTKETIIDLTNSDKTKDNLISNTNISSEKDSSKLVVQSKIIENQKSKKDRKIVIDSIPTKKGVYSNLYITPYIGLNQFRNLGNGTTNSSEYGEYTQKSMTNTNYGVYIRFMFNSKMGIRFGVGRKQLETKTYISKQVGQSLNFQNILFAKDLFPFNIDPKFINDTNVELNKTVTYSELPFEFYYIIKDGKIGIASALGFSFATRNENEVTLKSKTTPSFFIGSFRDYLKASGSANMALYFTYSITNRLNFEINPMIKYHYLGIENGQALKPIDVSLNTGFSYKLSH